MILICLSLVTNGFPGGTVVKNPTTTARDLRDTGSRSGRSPGVGNGIPLQHSCLGNPMEEPGGLQSMGSLRVGHD